MSAKKKTPQQLKAEQNKRYAANKKAKAEAARIEAALTPDLVVAPKANIMSEVVSIDTFNSEDFNEFAPNLGLPAMIQVPSFEELIAVAPQMPVETPQTKVCQPAPKELPVSLEAPTDAVVVERLINAINYLYPIARQVKGFRGPNLDHIKRITTNIELARILITRL